MLVDGTPVRERVPWQRVLEALDEVVLLLNERNVVTYASPSVAARLGHAPADLAGRSLGDVVHPDDLRGILRNLAELAVAGVVHGPLRVRRADGEHVWLECSLTRASGPDGTGDAVVLCGRDGTARATLEERSSAAARPWCSSTPNCAWSRSTAVRPRCWDAASRTCSAAAGSTRSTSGTRTAVRSGRTARSCAPC